MSDCSANAWRVPAEREPGVLYMHGHPSTDYAAVAAIEVDGQRFVRVDAIQNSETGQPFDFGKLAARLAGGER